MISRQETARPLLTPGEVMQLPPTDEVVMVAGIPPIRARKARYYEDERFAERILPPPALQRVAESPSEWIGVLTPPPPSMVDSVPSVAGASATDDEDITESEKRRQYELSSKLGPETEPVIADEFDTDRDTDEHPAVVTRTLDRAMQKVARQADLDPGDGLL